MSHSNKNVLLGVCGSIAAYRTPDLAAAIRREGFNVQTILTKAASEFVTKTSIACMSRGEVWDHSSPLIKDWRPAHIELADWADVAIIAPATASTIGKLATGIASGLLCETFLALPSDVPKAIAPAMNGHMLEQPPVQRNLNQLGEDGFTIISSRVGELACGYEGNGKVADIEAIISYLTSIKD